MKIHNIWWQSTDVCWPNRYGNLKLLAFFFLGVVEGVAGAYLSFIKLTSFSLESRALFINYFIWPKFIA